MKYEVLQALDDGATFFLGFCVLVGAAFVFYRSKRAALFFAIGGAVFCLGVAAELMLSRTTPHVAPAAMQLMFSALDTGRHLILFGGLALGLRAVAVQAPR